VTWLTFGPAVGSKATAQLSEVAVGPAVGSKTTAQISEVAVGPAVGKKATAQPSEVAVALRATVGGHRPPLQLHRRAGVTAHPKSEASVGEFDPKGIKSGSPGSLQILAVAAILLTSCAPVSQQSAFQSVQGEVSAQTGMQVVWNQGTADDQQAHDAAQQILARPLNANDAVRIALLNNPDLQATFEEIGISQADLVQAGLLHNPTLMASWRFPDRAPPITDTEYSLAADFLDLVLLPMKTKIAQSNLEQTESRIDQQVLELVTQVKTAFYTYQADAQLEGRLQLIGQADQAAADLAQAQQQAGNTTDLDLAERQAQFATAHVYLADAQKEKLAAREKLNRLMGLWGAAIDWRAAPHLPDLPDHESPLGHLESVALDQRRDLAAMKREADAIGMALALKTNTRFLPTTIDIGVDTEKSPDGQRVTGPTLDLTLPIFDQGQGEVAKLTAQYRMAQRELQSRAIQVQSEVREARANLKMDRDLVDYYKKTVLPLDIQIVNQSQLQFNAMQKNTFDLFVARQQELESEKDYVGAWRDYWIARAELEQAVGGRLGTFKSQP
jgi:cobalt-zinc-cadmium efflux system outer membrane protein